jgi:hypothetical protein
MKYFGVIADNGARGLNSWKEAAKRQGVKVVSYLSGVDAVVLEGELENLKNFAEEETYSWDAENVKDYVFDTAEEAKYDVEMFCISELGYPKQMLWKDL